MQINPVPLHHIFFVASTCFVVAIAEPLYLTMGMYSYEGIAQLSLCLKMLESDIGLLPGRWRTVRHLATKSYLRLNEDGRR